MKTMLKKLLSIGMAVSALPVILFADAVTPDSYSDVINVGESVTIHKTVTISNTTPTSAKVDVLFLADATGSMGSMISAAKSAAGSILSGVSGLGDVQFAVASYRDWPTYPTGGYGDYPFVLEQNLTTNAAAVQSAINSWTASGGADWEESQLYALEQSAIQTSWRSGSTRIVVWFGDAAGHDPSGTTTEEQAIAALNDKNIHVEALNTSTYGGGLNTNGQASRIATATDGDYYASINTSAIVSEISGAITSVFDNYSTVSLQAVGAENVSVSVSPAYTGTFDRSATRTFDFDVVVTGLTAGVDDFDVNVLVDGGIVAVENDHFTVNSDVPEPSTLACLSFGLFALLGFGIRRKK
jgi:hypothetical protein